MRNPRKFIMFSILIIVTLLLKESVQSSCRSNEIFINNQCKSCQEVTGVENCFKCEENDGEIKCEECLSDYGLSIDQDKCVKCVTHVPNCKQCFQTYDDDLNLVWACQQCTPPFYQEDYGKECKTCPITDCDQCSFEIFSLGCQKCKMNESTGAMFYDSNKNATHCLSCGFPNSQECEYNEIDNITKITECQKGYGHAQETKKCIKCDTGSPSDKIDGIDGCIQCEGFYKFKGDKILDTLVCTQCDIYKGLFPYNSQAIKNGPFMNIEECIPCSELLEDCEICKNVNSNYFMKEFTQCVSCVGAQGNYEENGTVVPSGYYDDGSKPFFCCSYKCSSCLGDHDTCTACAGNRIGAKCDCPPGFWPHIGEATCTPLRENCSLTQKAGDADHCCYNNKCQECGTDKNTCTICKDSGNPYVGEAPSCQCLPGSATYTYTEDDKVKESGGCIKCLPGTYTLEHNAPKCLECPDDKYECLGGMSMHLKKGWWRPSNISTEKFECFNKEGNCKGGTAQGNDLCEIGYVGANCEACDLENIRGHGSYANSGEFDCSNCSKVSNNVVKIIGITIFQLFLMYFSVGGTLTAIQDKIKLNSLKILFDTHDPQPDEQGALMKILQHYFYIIGVIATFRLELPDSLKGMQGTASNPAKQMSFSFDCFLYDMQQTIPNIYFRIIWQILMAVSQIIFVVIVVSLIILIKKPNISFKAFLCTSITYQFIAVQPGLISMVLESIACRQFGEKSYILANVSMECYNSDYNKYSLGFLLPVLSVLALAVPMALYFTLRSIANGAQSQQPKISSNSILPADPQDLEIIKENNTKDIEMQHSIPINQQSLFHKIKTKTLNYTEIDIAQQQEKFIPPTLDSAKSLQKYGYLYLEYRKQVFWWEFVKIAQRILIASILSFYYADIKLKGILVFLTVFIYAIMSVSFRPYAIPSQNKVDILATIITAVSLVIGLFLWENDYDYWFIFGIFIMIVINLYLILAIFSRIGSSKARVVIQKASQVKEQQHQLQEKQTLLAKIAKLKQQNEQHYKSLQHLKKETQAHQSQTQEIHQNNQQLKAYQDQIQNLDLIQLSKQEESILHQTSTLEQEKNLKESDNKMPLDVQIISALASFIELIGSKCFNQPTEEVYKIVKQVKKDLKQSVSKFIYGVYANQIQITKLQVPGLPASPFTSQQYLAGELSKEEHITIEKEVKNYKQTLFDYHKKILNTLSIKFAQKLQQLNYPKYLWEEKLSQKQDKSPSMMESHGPLQLQQQPEQEKEEDEEQEQEQEQDKQIEIEVEKPAENNINLPQQQSESQQNLDSIASDTKLQYQPQQQPSSNTLVKYQSRMSSRNSVQNKLPKQQLMLQSTETQQYHIETLDIEHIFTSISKKELKENLASFKLFDASTSGIITKQQLSLIMGQLGQNVSQKDLNHLVSKVDSDGNGEVDFTEFISLVALQKYQERPETEMREIFHWFDSQADGFLDWEEIQHMVHVLLDIKYPKQILQEIIRSEDQDGDNKLNYSEFIRIIL